MSAVTTRLVNAAKENKSREGGFALITLALMIIIPAGFLSNEMVIYGYSTIAPNTGVQCTETQPNYFFSEGSYCGMAGPAYNVQGNCNGNATYCGFHQVTFIAPNTPLYYLLIQQNPVAFFTSIFNGQEQSNTYQIGSTICVPLVENQSGILVLSNSTGRNIQNFQCYGRVAYSNIQPPTVTVGMATSNYGNNSIWTLTGCPWSSVGKCIISGNPPVLKFVNGTGTEASATFYGFYVKNGTIIQNNAGGHCAITDAETQINCLQVLAKLLTGNGGTSFQCPNTAKVDSININRTTYYCLIPVPNPQALGENSTGNSFGFFGVVTGLILIVLGLGVYFAFSVVGSGTQVGSNPQGSKLAQHYGLGIFVFGIFDTLFGNGILLFDNILAGLGDLMFSMVVILYFFGLWEIL